MVFTEIVLYFKYSHYSILRRRKRNLLPTGQSIAG
jgi:hypothetical protein